MKYELSARRLKEAMADRGLSQQALSDKTKINKSSISQWVNGRNVPSNFKAYELSQVLDVAPEWLMGIPDVPKYNLNVEYQKLNKSQQNRLIAYIKSLKAEK